MTPRRAEGTPVPAGSRHARAAVAARLMPSLHRRPQVESFPSAQRARQLTLQMLDAAARARRQLLVLVPLLVGTLLAYRFRRDLFGLDAPIRVVAALVMIGLGWALARDIGRWLAPALSRRWPDPSAGTARGRASARCRARAPALFRRMDPATAGTVGFLIRLAFLTLTTLVALRLAGLRPETLAVGGAITAVIFGLAAQQTLGNLIAGLVLISARPFRVGDRVRLQAGNLAGQLEGVVSSLGLLYTTFAQGEDSIMVPNTTVLSSAIVPLREPASVDLRARLRPDVRPSEVQALLQDAVRTPVRTEPHIALEEVDSDEVVVRIAATPVSQADGPRLADEILAAIASVTSPGDTEERMLRRRSDRVDGEEPMTQEYES